MSTNPTFKISTQMIFNYNNKMRGQVSRNFMHLLEIKMMTRALASLKSPQKDKGNFHCQTEQYTLTI